MEPPSSGQLRDVLAQLEAENWSQAETRLDALLEQHPRTPGSYEALEGAEASMSEKAWACTALARDRVKSNRYAVARVAIRSAIDHVEDTVEETTIDASGDMDLDPNAYK